MAGGKWHAGHIDGPWRTPPTGTPEYREWTYEERRAAALELRNLCQLVRLAIPRVTEWSGDKGELRMWWE